MNLPVLCIHRLGAIAALLLAAGCASQAAVKEPDAESEKQALAAGYAAERQGDYESALVDYVKALADNPDNAETHFRIAQVHRVLGNTATAAEAYQRALKLDPGHAGALEGLGLLLLEQGKRDAAGELLHKAASKDNTRPATFNGLGILADLDGKHDLAQAYFGHALELRPHSGLLLNNLGYSYYLAGDYGTAQDYFEKTLALEPTNRNGWSNLALVHARRGDYAHAVECMEKIMDQPSARYSIGYIAMLDGKLADAEKLLVAAIRRSTSYNAPAQAALKRVRDEEARLAGGGAAPDFN